MPLAVPRSVAVALLFASGCDLYFDAVDRDPGGEGPDAGASGHVDARPPRSDAAGQPGGDDADAAAPAGSARVLVLLGYDAGPEAWMLEGALEADGRFDDVDSWVIAPDNGTLPGASTLASYDALVYGWNDEATLGTDTRVYLGNWLADFVDAGGGLVTVGNAQGRNALLGRVLAAGYLPLRPPPAAPYTLGTAATLVIDAPGHPLVAGVDAMTASQRSITEVDPDATLAASWSDGLPLAAIKGPVASLGLHLDPTDLALAGDWQQLLANATTAAIGD
jgi:hypothetical protein